MKTIAILAAALSLSLAACATDEDTTNGMPRPPLGKPQIEPQTDVAQIEESFDIGAPAPAPQKEFDDGRLEWAETIGKLTYLHRYNEQLGVDEISVLDENGDVHCCVNLRGQLTELDHGGVK